MVEFKYYWEDLEVGRRFSFGGYRVTEEEIIEFGTRYDPLPHHVDKAKAETSPMGKLCASGIHTIGMAHKMLCDNLFCQSSLVAGRGIEAMRMRIPVIPGDVLNVEIEVVESTPHHSRDDRGWTEFSVKVVNQKGLTAMTYGSKILFLSKGRVQ